VVAPITWRLPESIELLVRPRAVLGRAVAADAPRGAVVAAFAAPIAAASAFYAMSYAGAVSAGHFLANVALHLFVFSILAGVAIGVGKLLTGRPVRRIAHAYALSFVPLEIFFLFLLGVFLVAPDPYLTVLALAQSWILPILFGVVLLWSALLTHLAFRALCEGRGLRAALCTLSHYALFGGLTWVYIWGMQLLPLPEGR
jgi:hypothetical protein